MTDPATITEEARGIAGPGLSKHPQMTGPWHILAASSPADERTRVLKHGDTFAVFDHYGDVIEAPGSPEGVYHEDTRCLSGL